MLSIHLHNSQNNSTLSSSFLGGLSKKQEWKDTQSFARVFEITLLWGIKDLSHYYTEVYVLVAF